MKTEGAPPTWGEGIRFLRGLKGLTQSALAEKAGVTQSIISALESGSRGATDQTRIRISRALDINPHILFPYVDREAS